jgi:hypothetical protein
MEGVAVAAAPAAARPARAGWFDALAPLVERLPGPAWAYYAVTSAILLGWMATVAEANGKPFGAGYALFGLQVVMPVALGHHFTDVARSALRRFRPLLDVDDARFAEIEHDFLTLSPGATWVATVVALALGSTAVFLSPEEWFGSYATSYDSMLAGIAPVIFLFVIPFGPFITRSIRQLVLVTRLHAAAPVVDPLRPGPTYAFSDFTVRVGLAMLVYGYGWLVADIETITASPVAYLLDAAFMAIAVAFFVLPLWGMHRRLVAGRDALLDSADGRLQTVIAELHRRADALDLRDADPLNKTIGSLIAERDVILKAPTWPWRPGTLNAFISLLAAPVILFIITRVLGRFV